MIPFIEFVQWTPFHFKKGSYRERVFKHTCSSVRLVIVELKFRSAKVLLSFYKVHNLITGIHTNRPIT